MNTNGQTSGSILVIDDEASLRETFHFFLTREGYGPVLTASGFEEALSIIGSEEIDLVISDIVLEKSSGVELLKHVRKNGMDCPFIVITGYPDVDTAAESLRFGAFDYILKPVDKETLLRSVRLALKQRHLEVQRRQAEMERERYRTFLDTVFKSASDAIIIVDSSLKILKVNGAAQHLFADVLPELDLEKNLNSEITSAKFSTLRSDLLRVLRTGMDVKEHRFECETVDHVPKVLSICASPFKVDDNGRQGAVIIIRDMTVQPEYQHNKRSSFHRFIGSSDAMQTVYTMIENVGRVETTVLISGESGTGKELAAEALHRESPRKDQPLIKLDCAAIPDNLLESELFGHKKGSFTGADKDRKGLILQAEKGTLFLDEIGEISSMTQLRLLRFLQERTFYPVGSDTPIVVDARVITATNVDLKEKVHDGSFREDLYFRLKVIDIELPALRDRDDDVILLAQHFARKYGEKIKKVINGFSDDALLVLRTHAWPGNVRELEHLVERAVVLCQGTTITTAELPDDLLQPVVREVSGGAEPQTRALDRDEEQQAGSTEAYGDPDSQAAADILQTLSRCGGNKAKAARLLGIDRSTLYRRIKELDIDVSSIALE